MDPTGRAALITGGRRIGQVVAAELAKRGADIALGYARSLDAANAGAAMVRDAGRRAAVLQADLATPDGCKTLVARAARELGRLDILINMASVYERKAFDALELTDWNRALDVDLRATFLCAHAAAGHMRLQGGGRIVNVSDWTAASGRPRYKGFLPYYVAKAGVIALTEVLALELADDHILVNAVAPGPIVAPPGTTDEEVEAVEQATPLGRWGGELEIAKAIVALVDTDFMTGETVRVDGGRHVK